MVLGSLVIFLLLCTRTVIRQLVHLGLFPATGRFLLWLQIAEFVLNLRGHQV